MDKKVFGPLLIILLIVGSIVSWGVLEMKRQQEQAPSQEQPTEPTPESFPQIAFFADDVDANIHEWTAWFLLYGFTDETNLVSVIESVLSVSGIDRISNSKFLDPEPEKERFMPFYAEIIPSRDSNIEEIMEEIKEKGVLSEIEVYRKAVVKIPSKLTLQSAQRDLNISRDANFEEPFAICVVSTDSMLADNLKIRLSLVMQGDTVIRETMEAFMKQNLSAMPQFNQTLVSRPISGLDRMLGFEKTVKYNGFDSEDLKASLEDLNGVQEVELKLEKIEGAFTLDINTAGLEGTDINALEEDLNSAFIEIEGIKKVFFHEKESSLEARITYDKELGYGSIRQEAIYTAESTLFGIKSIFIDPRADLSGSIQFSDTNAAELASAAESIFLSFGVVIDLWQQAYFDINSLTDTKTGKTFILREDQQELPIRVKPGLEFGEELSIQIMFQTIRKDVSAVYSAESQG